ncbi:MAG: trypsin-like peptidase domain-containing protein [Firmicutes bacterium]|nr:trypsin-like peptidase domain-containing protein [Bacillota bacterium]
MECPKCLACPVQITSENEKETTIRCPFCLYSGKIVSNKALKDKINNAVQDALKDLKVPGGEAVYSKNRPAVVEINSKYKIGGGNSSGFVINAKDGYIMTNEHCVVHKTHGAAVQVTITDENGKQFSADIVNYGKPNGIDDLAMLKVKGKSELTTQTTLGCSDAVKNGQKLFVMGNPHGEGISITSGIVGDTKRKRGEGVQIMTDAAINPGNSGGPVFNQNGEVIAVVVESKLNADGMRYSIPINHAKDFIKKTEKKIKQKII